jgi:TATA-box binding protein (TBP) (component of TFIID and TFIIIB)
MKYFLHFYLIFILQPAKGQTYSLEKSKITFFSEAPIENIDATTTTARGIFKENEAQIAFSVPIKTFRFKKSLMQEHFNENYLESDKYPNATFSGIILNYDPHKEKQEVTALGKMTIHGITKEVSLKGIIEKHNNKIMINSNFKVKLEEYDIKIPKVVFYNIAEVVDVDAEFIFHKN